jgi:hypothetical protein
MRAASIGINMISKLIKKVVKIAKIIVIGWSIIYVSLWLILLIRDELVEGAAFWWAMFLFPSLPTRSIILGCLN